MQQRKFMSRCNSGIPFEVFFFFILGLILLHSHIVYGWNAKIVRIDLRNKNTKYRKLKLPQLTDYIGIIPQSQSIFQLELSHFTNFLKNVFVSLTILSSCCDHSSNANALESSRRITVNPNVITLNGPSDGNDETHSQVRDINNYKYLWNLPNGDVELKGYPFLTNFPQYKLSDPILLGSGGGGAVFSTKSHIDNNDHKDDENGVRNSNEIALKVSWNRSSKSVEKECQILQELKKTETRNVEICLGIEKYSNDLSGRVAIALQPVFTGEEVVSSVDKMNDDVQAQAVQSIVRTLVDMLSVNVVTTDVQPLMGRETGSVLFIDLTEAQIISSPEPTFLDLALASSFISEMTALIPEYLTQTASNTFQDELTKFHLKGNILPLTIYELLKDQSSLIDSNSMKIIDSKIALYEQ